MMTRTIRLPAFAALCTLMVACQHPPDPTALRGARVDPAQFFDNDRLRADTLLACHAGTHAQQQTWASLYACRTALLTDQAKRHGWKPQ